MQIGHRTEILGGVQVIYSWDCIMLQWNEHPSFLMQILPSPNDLYYAECDKRE